MSTFQQDISKYIEGLAEFSGDIFWIKNTDFTKQIYISPAYETIWGRSCESMYADPRSWTDYIFPEDLERLHATIEKCRQNITPSTRYTISYRIKRPDGKLFWIREKGCAIYDSKNQFIGFGGVAQDITSFVKNQKVEQEVKVISAERDSYEEYLRSIVDSIAGNHWWKDRKGVYRGYNQTLLKSLGYHTSSDIIGKTDYELPWADQADHLVAHDREVMRRGVSIEREEVLTNNVGQRRIYLVNKAPLRDPNGEIIGTIGHGFDITSLKVAQEELEKSRLELEGKKYSTDTHLLAIIESVGGNHFIKDLSGQYIACNNSLAKECGLNSSQEMIGKTDHELPWSPVADSIVQFDKEVIEKDQPNTKEQAVVLPNGKLNYYIISRVPLHDNNNNVVGILGTSMNITEQKQREKQLKKEKEHIEALCQKKSSVLSIINREIRTPLNSILGSTEIINRKLSDSDLKNYVEDIDNAANNLLMLVRNTLNSSQLGCNWSEFNVQELIRVVVSDVVNRLQSQAVRVECECVHELPEVIIGDSFRLKQVLINLIDTVLKTSHEGVVKVSATYESMALTTVTLLFEVKNTSVNISKSLHEKILHSLMQVDSEYNDIHDDDNINLSLSKKIIETMNGEIQVNEDANQGVRFWFTLPFRLPIDTHQIPDDSQAASVDDLITQTTQFDNCSVLVVEDNILNQKVTKVLLEDLGCIVDIASDGESALECIERNSYDIVFMDVGLPEMDGIKVTEHIRSDSAAKNTAIVGLTAHVSEEDIQRCYDARMNDVLTKPVSLDQLRKVISRLCVESCLG